MKFRKAMALLLAGTMALSMAACGGGSSSSSSDSSSSDAESQIPQTALTAQMSHCP